MILFFIIQLFILYFIQDLTELSDPTPTVSKVQSCKQTPSTKNEIECKHEKPKRAQRITRNATRKAIVEEDAPIAEEAQPLVTKKRTRRTAQKKMVVASVGEESSEEIGQQPPVKRTRRGKVLETTQVSDENPTSTVRRSSRRKR